MHLSHPFGIVAFWFLLCPTSILFNSRLIAPSEGSVVAYYLSEFKVPVGQEASVDRAMSTVDTLVDKERRSMAKSGNSLVLDEVVTSGRVKATEDQTTVIQTIFIILWL